MCSLKCKASLPVEALQMRTRQRMQKFELTIVSRCGGHCVDLTKVYFMCNIARIVSQIANVLLNSLAFSFDVLFFVGCCADMSYLHRLEERLVTPYDIEPDRQGLARDSCTAQTA